MIFKKIIRLKLRILAKMILKKYRPEIIGITGSIGKTSAKNAIHLILSSKFSVRKSEKNYNNEIGLPLTVIGADSPHKSIAGWIGVFFRAFGLMLSRDRNYPEVLILEMGADRPGDIDYLLKIAKPKVGVITGVAEAHLEFFKSLESVKKEKTSLVRPIGAEGFAILNGDDPSLASLSDELKCETIKYGFNEDNDAVAAIANGGLFGVEGASFKVKYQGSVVPVFLPMAIGRPAVYAALAACAVGSVYGINLIDAANALKEFRLPKGRMNLIPGVKRTLIIDDTYNSSPRASLEALDALAAIKLPEAARRFAVFGDMLELGKYTEEGHERVGERAARLGVDFIITAGERSRDIGRGAERAGMSRDRIFHFAKNSEAGLFLQDRIRQGDLILVKGSQSARMEKVVKEIMAEPLRAEELLVRFDKEWRDRI